MAEDTRKPLLPDLQDLSDSEVVALAVDATAASEEGSREDAAVAEASVAVIVDSEAAVVEEVSAGVAIAASARLTVMVHLLMLPLAQVPVAVLVDTVVTEIVVGMTPAAAVAHMMTDPAADVTAVVAAIVAAIVSAAATGIDEVAPTSSPSVTVDRESIATTTDPEKTTPGSAGTKAATRTRESSAGTKRFVYQDKDLDASWWVSSVFSQSVPHVLSARLSFCLLSPRVSKGKILSTTPVQPICTTKQYVTIGQQHRVSSHNGNKLKVKDIIDYLPQASLNNAHQG